MCSDHSELFSCVDVRRLGCEAATRPDRARADALGLHLANHPSDPRGSQLHTLHVPWAPHPPAIDEFLITID